MVNMILILSFLTYTTQTCFFLRNRKLIYIMYKSCWQYFILLELMPLAISFSLILHKAGEVSGSSVEMFAKHTMPPSPPPQTVP